MGKRENTSPGRLLSGYANFVVARPAVVLAMLLGLGVIASFGAARLTINSNQLDLISQDLPEVVEVKRVLDMVGGTGFVMLALRSNEEADMKLAADEVAALLREDKEDVRSVTYKAPVDFVQQNMVLFVQPDDLKEAKRRINKYIHEEIRRTSPFFFELVKTEPPKLDLSDLVAKYNSIGKKSIIDDYYLSRDHKMLLLLIKPMWDPNQLGKTDAFIKKVDARLAEYSRTNAHGFKLVEDYKLVGQGGTIAYGYTGSYKTALDDSYAIARSLRPVMVVAFLGILLVTGLFFRRLWPTLIVMTGVALGTLITLGFTYVTVGQLNMITSILGGILMGLGVDFGIHFTFRTRIELGTGKSHDEAVRQALMQAGRPAAVSAIVTAGSFLILMVSEFRGFSQFGFLAAFGTLIIALTLFSFCGALLVLLGRRWPALPERIVGRFEPREGSTSGDLRIPRPRLMLGVAGVIVGLLCAAAVPWSDAEPVANASLWQRLMSGVHFDYNTRALLPDDQFSVKLQDEIRERFNVSTDPIGVRTKTLAEAKEIWDELNGKPEVYDTIDQVVSIYSFVPPRERAEKNAKLLAEWKEELADIDPALLPAKLQGKVDLFKRILDAKPFGPEEVPDVYASQFRNLATTKPENHGFLTFIYPSVDVHDTKAIMRFYDQVNIITTASGKHFQSAGLSILYAKLARIVLHDGKTTVFLSALWILVMLLADFRSLRLALASVIPLGVGLVLMLGIMSLVDWRLNFMNIIILPIVLAFGVSHGVYLLHRFLEGTSPLVALSSVGAAVAASTLTTIVGFGSLLTASHVGLRSMGVIACLGLTTILMVSFTVLAAVLELLHERRRRTPQVDDDVPPMREVSAAQS